MSLYAEIEDVISGIVEPPQRIYLRVSRWNKTIEFEKPKIEFEDTSTDTETKNILSGDTHSIERGKIVTNFSEIRRRLKVVKLDRLTTEITNILDSRGISKRTKMGKWYDRSCHRCIKHRDDLADQLYQIVQYYRSPTQPGPATATKHKNVLGLLKMFYQKHGET
jgi:hypothetical protein